MQDSQVRTHREVRVKDLFLRFYLIIIFFLLLTAFLFVAIFVIRHWVAIVLGGVALLVYIILTLKTFAIGCVLAYKSYAPMKVRDRCRFEPSCSTYMILAIEKYGLFKGVAKGINRINRCHAPNGGVDYP